MCKVILFPTHKGYCSECIYNHKDPDYCSNEDYKSNSYKVNCVWGYCKYKKVRTNENTEM